MQYPFSCMPQVLAAIEKTMSPARLARYLPTTGGDKHLALRLYVWNARLCEEFYVPLQMTEIGFRNGVARRLQSIYGNWIDSTRFWGLIPRRHQEELVEVRTAERAKRGAGFTNDHVVAGLSFGFWLYLMGQKPRHVLWKYGVADAFPKMPATIGREDLYDRLDQFRKFRNSVMHHYAIFDKNPTHEWLNIQTLIGWMCSESLWLVKELSNPHVVMQNRPLI